MSARSGGLCGIQGRSLGGVEMPVARWEITVRLIEQSRGDFQASRMNGCGVALSWVSAEELDAGRHEQEQTPTLGVGDIVYGPSLCLEEVARA